MIIVMKKKPEDQSTPTGDEPKFAPVDTREFISIEDLPDEDLRAMAEMRVKNDPTNLDHLFE